MAPSFLQPLLLTVTLFVPSIYSLYSCYNSYPVTLMRTLWFSSRLLFNPCSISHLQDDLAARMPGFDLFVGFLRLL